MSGALPLHGQIGFPSAELIHGLQPRPDQIGATRHQEIVRRVMESFRAAKTDQSRVSSAFLPCGARARFVDSHASLFQSMLEGDTSRVENELRNFWRSDLGVFVKEFATYQQLITRVSPSLERFETQVRRNLAAWQSLFEMDDRVLEVPEVGNPWGLSVAGRLITPKAMRFHAWAQQIGELCRAIARPLVVEVDAAYGGQSYFLLRDYPQAKVIEFDLPETMVLSQYYLLCALPDREIALYGEFRGSLEDRLIDHDALILPNYELKSLPDRSVDLFHNSLSFGEASMGTLTAYFEQMQRSLKRYLLLCNSDRAKISGQGFERIPVSRYPIQHEQLRSLYRRFDLLLGAQSDLRELLFERVHKTDRNRS